MSKPTIVQGEDTVFGRRYVRLTDHERLQAETERLQADRAADNARIAALSEALQACLEVEERPEIVAMARKALAQRGKEGEC